MIQWYPGHMAKTLREIKQNIKHVDIIIELVDARAPMASQNPMLEPIIRHKTKVVLLMKSDLADAHITEEWVRFIQKDSTFALDMNVNDKKNITNFLQLLQEIGKDELQKRKAKGIQKKSIRMLIAKIGDRPGVTRQPLWIKVGKQFELLDTPGVLWPKFEDQIIGMKLAAIGSIKYELVPAQDVAAFVIKYIGNHYPTILLERYDLDDIDDMWEVFIHIGKRRGALEKGGRSEERRVGKEGG